MLIKINGTNTEISRPSIEAVLEAEAVPREDWKAIAVARNGSVIPKSDWDKTEFSENDRIEIVRPFAGG